ncbi:ATP-dependent endonuclease [Prosthecobacter sp.]|uniref:ATP-dependent nuclease n=1 Tax=Prosthecobacter sp. TaxID=1965333 RepID=UPI0024879A2C|nr:ATP-dependent endonuclease [Prosthecobacter sp.]MDI1311271.1 ATP-dependent endonuclease [Prosthecobacter sp.]
MKIDRIEIRNFRRLENVSAAIEDRETVFVGPNNSGKTSATAIFRCFLGQRKFRIYDFSVARIPEFDDFGVTGEADALPSIELDIWFKVDPNSIEFGRAFTLLPNLSDNFERLGVRLRYATPNPAKLREAYLTAYPQAGEEAPEKTLSAFLSDDRELNRHFEITYASLEATEAGVTAATLDKDEGRNLLQSLVRIDFVGAQRNIDDDEENRSNRLSRAFAGFYQKNLERPEVAEDAHRVINENNRQLTDHYAKQFAGIMGVIKGIGVPSVNDRELRIVSTLNPETALSGNTDLLYVDVYRGHELPELYNGLGFKNLIYMAIQAKHYHSQWVRTSQNRPLCQIIFIEEPEVHLHAQVQQTFITNIWDVIQQSAEAEEAGDWIPQLIVTTHSSHILDATEFGKVRYFRRCHLNGEAPDPARILNATQVHSLRDFQPTAVEIADQPVTPEEALAFLKRYLRLTHCDLFFADAAVLVEGSVEKLLMPTMIDKAANRLRASYLTVLEIGGAYAHRFDELLSFLCIPYLIVTDLDSVDPTGRHPACRADTPGALTSNASLKHLLEVNSVDELMCITPDQKHSAERGRYITFQQDITVTDGGATMNMRPRTLEEAFAYQNFARLRDGTLSLNITIPEGLGEAYNSIYEHIKSSSFKKTDFAMDVLASEANWQVPAYIAEGLAWLENRLYPPVPAEQP